ncbi:MAG: feruloyl-CoA synthase [Hyphomicrobiales bacterium]|nr:feruloyl-CoA synthase [Hyphomicrobiales bacterium]
MNAKGSALPERAVALGPQQAELDRRQNGIIYVRSVAPAPQPERAITVYLQRWAEKTPDAVFVAARDRAGAWRKLTYAQFYAQVQSIAAALLTRDVSVERPVAILSGNSIEHLLLGFACMHIGVPYAPISTAYSLISSDYGKLRYILDLLTPGLIFADDGALYGKAIAAVAHKDAEIVTVENGEALGATPFAALAADNPAAVAAAHAKVGPDTIAKFLFTSGSTGAPKGVVNPQRMLCANILQIAESIREIANPQTLLDWLPWNHTFGGNHNTHIALYGGGTLYIDDGRPTPREFALTIRNLKEIAPTAYFNVPKGFEMLVSQLATDQQLREKFFSRLRFIMYAGASLPQHVWDELERLAFETVGEKIRIVTGLGATETGPSALFVTAGEVRAGMVGNPVSACEIKLIPNAGKLEARVRGPNITPGYWRKPDITAAAFDEEGFYKLGDALKFVDENDPQKGFIFDGRVSEDFKLRTGTWVSVGGLRSKIVSAFAPFVRDAVITGHDRDDVCAILLLDTDGCRAFFPQLARESGPADYAAHEPLREALAQKLAALQKTATGSSSLIARLAIFDDHPSIDHGEITDKGSINQRAVLAHRPHLVEALYDETPPALVITVR